MFGVPVLEVAIGLAFVYLLFSLFASAVNEAILGHLVHLRSHVLEDGLNALLSNTGSKSPPIVDVARTLWKAVVGLAGFVGLKTPPRSQSTPSLAGRVIEHPLVQGLTMGGRKCPSYLPANTFSNAVIGILLEIAGQVSGSDATKVFAGIANLNEPYAQKLLGSLLAGVTDLQEARQRLEKWFNDSMDRVSGAYKRNVQFWLYIWGTLIVISLNIDTIEIARKLLTDAEFRTALVNNANSFSTTNTNLSVAQLQTEIDELNLPLGWGSCTNNSLHSVPGWVLAHVPFRLLAPTNNVASVFVSGTLSGAAPCPQTNEGWWLKALGLLITVGAVSQGAPFWFDILNKVTNLRAAGRPPKVE